MILALWTPWYPELDLEVTLLDSSGETAEILLLPKGDALAGAVLTPSIERGEEDESEGEEAGNGATSEQPVPVPPPAEWPLVVRTRAPRKWFWQLILHFDGLASGLHPFASDTFFERAFAAIACDEHEIWITDENAAEWGRIVEATAASSASEMCGWTTGWPVRSTVGTPRGMSGSTG